jgi:hypothetical protein
MASILEQIRDNILTSLATVNGTGGYSNTFTVEARKRRGNAPQAGQTLAVVAMGSPIKLPSAAFDQNIWDQPFFIDIYVNPDESSGG